MDIEKLKRYGFSGNRLGKGINSLKNFYAQLGFTKSELKEIFGEIDRAYYGNEYSKSHYWRDETFDEYMEEELRDE